VRAAMQPAISRRGGRQQPLDVLVQHLVTVALGGGFTPDALLKKCETAAYRDLSRRALAVVPFLRAPGRPLAGRVSRLPPRLCPMKKACGACPTRGWRGATA
jgi:hypothetical protein